MNGYTSSGSRTDNGRRIFMNGHTSSGSRMFIAVLILLTAGLFSACDQTPVVGGILDPGQIPVKADTVRIGEMSVKNAPVFSGNLEYVSTGRVQDPVFGEIQATAMIRPSIYRSEQGADSIAKAAPAYLSLNIRDLVGQEGPSDFQIVEIERRWRSSSWSYDSIPPLSNRVIGEFTVDRADSILVPLHVSWSDRYREFYMKGRSPERDSLYRVEMPGLAIIPAEGADKMFSVPISQTRLIFKNEEVMDDDEAESYHSMQAAWAVSLKKEKPGSRDYGASIMVDNIFGSMLKLDFEISEEFLGGNNFSRVELVLYKDHHQLRDIPGPAFVRPSLEFIQLFYLNEEDLDYAIFEDPLYLGVKREDHSFRINITDMANELLFDSGSNRRLYVVAGANDGRYTPILLGGTGHAQLKPEILVTGIIN